MKLLMVAKHPESCQSTYDLVEFLTKDASCDVTVYGVQNVSQNKTRIIERKNVKFIESDDNGNKLDIDVLHKELTEHHYDELLVIHTVNIVATIMKSLEGTLEAVTTKTLLYCEIPRDFPHRRYFDNLKTLVDNPKLHNKVRFSTAGKTGLVLLKKLVTEQAFMLPFGVTLGSYYPIPRDVARAAIEFLDDGTFIIFSIGRADTGVMMFASFLGANPGVKAKLMLPIEENLTDIVKEFYTNEMSLVGFDESAALDMLVLMKDVAFMNNDELNVLVCASDVVVHANPVTDQNVYVPEFSLTAVPQVVPDIAFNTEFVDKSLLTKVSTVFNFYTYDEYGGRLSLCSHKDFASVLSSMVTTTGVLQHATKSAHTLALKTNGLVTTTLAWQNWKVAVEDTAKHGHQGHCPKVDHRDGSSKHEFSSEIDQLKSKLSSLLLKIGKDSRGTA